MARLPRYSVPGQPLYVIQRGNNRSTLFAARADYRFFLDCLKAACTKHACRVHAYVLMTDHVHLLMTPEQEGGVGKVMQSVGRRYVQYFNLTYVRTGTLWEGRYRATLVDADRYLLTCYRYIELNPVRAGLAAHPGLYRWSSYGGNALGRRDPAIDVHEQYRLLGSTDNARQAAYRALFQRDIDEPTIRRIREATHKGWALGSDRFHDEITGLLNRRARPLPKGGDRRSKAVKTGSGTVETGGRDREWRPIANRRSRTLTGTTLFQGG